MSAEERLALQRLWWDTPWMWIMVVAILCGSALVGLSVMSIRGEKKFNTLQSEAIQRGHAEWQDDGTGHPVFKWK